MRDPEIMSQVKEILAKISKLAPGHAVELRIPPYSAIQCVEGPKHTRGTPPNVVEMSADVLFDISTGKITWQSAIADGRISASGERSDLSALFQQLGAAE
ncbi:MAG: sterol carrier family protein [Actinobacteria bacterium]|nr:sterol carrier family protein [Actinomycetota bacterium]